MPPKWAAQIPPNQQVGERERLKVFANWPGGVVQDFAGNSVLAGDPECRFAGGLPLVIAGVLRSPSFLQSIESDSQLILPTNNLLVAIISELYRENWGAYLSGLSAANQIVS
jgi:hypothetical protein